MTKKGRQAFGIRAYRENVVPAGWSGDEGWVTG